MSGPVDPRLGDLLTPTASEVDALTDAPGWRAAVALATEPSDAEVAALVPPTAVPAPAAPWKTVLLAAAVVLLVSGWWARPHGTPTLARDALTLVSPAEVWRLTDAATVTGNATLTLVQRSDHGAELEQASGRAVYEVDPDGDARDLTVIAGDVRVRVTGTRFVVSADEPVRVAVERGSVAVSWPGGEVALRAGDRWTRPADVALAAHPAATPVAEPSPGSTDRRARPLDPTARSPQRGPDPPRPPGVDAMGAPAPSEPLDTSVEPPLPPNGAAPAPAAEPAPAALAEPTPVAVDAARDWVDLLDRRDAAAAPDVLLASVDRFIDAWPTSPLADEARFLRLELQARHADPVAAVVILEHWIDTHPADPHRTDALLLHASVAVNRLADCARARRSLDELAEEPRAAPFEDACTPTAPGRRAP